VYLAALLEGHGELPCELVGVVDPSPQRCSQLPALRDRGIPVFATIEEFYRQRGADLAVISSPIHLHCRQTCHALEQGSHVLCEKPAAATVQDVDRMLAACDRCAKWVAIGYQWSFTESIQRLKRDIRAGLFGAPRRLKTLCLWPRDEGYYRRNDWAGCVRDEHGEWILDSPVNNAMAHDLHNALYLLGREPDRSASPVAVTAELYRANEIPNFDTAALRVHTADGVEILFYGSHAVVEDSDPVFRIEFTGATVEFAGGMSPVVARFDDGRVQRYASPNSPPQTRKLSMCVEAVAAGSPIPCGLEAARPHAVCTNGAHDSYGEPLRFPGDMIRVTHRESGPLTWVDGLAEDLRQCYVAGALPSELGVSWAHAGKTVDLRDYRHFPGGAA
jgi:predicted dehydrogenase